MVDAPELSMGSDHCRSRLRGGRFRRTRPVWPGVGRPRALVPGASASSFVEPSSEPFGVFGGVDYVRHTGRFEGSTVLGAYCVPYEIIAPADPTLGTATLLVEPPHFAFGPVGRDLVLSRGFLFGKGIRYAAVGFGLNGLNILDPTATNLMIAGSPVVFPVPVDLRAILDEEILVQFTHALTTKPFPVGILGAIDRRYAYGASQTSGALLETLLGPGGQGLFDLTLLHVALWRPPFQPPGVFDFITGEFAPVSGVGRVVFVETEGDQVLSDAEFRRAADEPEYRVYEIAGAAYVPSPDTNPLDHTMILSVLPAVSRQDHRGPDAVRDRRRRGRCRRTGSVRRRGEALFGEKAPERGTGGEHHATIDAAWARWSPFLPDRVKIPTLVEVPVAGGTRAEDSRGPKGKPQNVCP